MSAITAAIIGASGALFTAYVAQFQAERYRRFAEATSVAAGILGELKSYSSAHPLLANIFTSIKGLVENGQRDEIALRPFDKPVDRYFDAVIAKVGLLGPDLAERIIYIYSNLDAFRGSFALICVEHLKMTDVELWSRIELTEQCMQRAVTEMSNALPLLETRVNQPFRFWSLA